MVDISIVIATLEKVATCEDLEEVAEGLVAHCGMLLTTLANTTGDGSPTNEDKRLLVAINTIVSAIEMDYEQVAKIVFLEPMLKSTRLAQTAEILLEEEQIKRDSPLGVVCEGVTLPPTVVRYAQRDVFEAIVNMITEG